MGNLISYNQRIHLRNSLQNDLLRFFREKKGHYTFTELLDFKAGLRENAIKRFATEKNPNRIPNYMWNEFNGFFSALMELNYDEVEGGYMIFGRFYRHSGSKTAFPDIPTWQDLCSDTDDYAFRQKLLNDNYVQIWKCTRKIYSERPLEEKAPEYPRMVFWEETPKNFRFDIVMGLDNHMKGSEPISGTTDMYKKVWDLMEKFGIDMRNVEEL